MSPTYTKIAKIRANQVRVELPHCCNQKQFIEAIDILTWFEVIGYRVLLHNDIQQSSHSEVVLWDCLQNALTQINPDVPKIAIEAAVRNFQLNKYPKLSCGVGVPARPRLERARTPIPQYGELNFWKSLSKIAHTSPEIVANRSFHEFLINGVDVEYELNGQIVNQKVRLIDTCNLLKNDWLVIHKFTVIEGNYTYKFDAVIFINGLPLAIILRADSDRKTLKQTYLQLQNYQQLISKLFFYNVFLVITCKNQAKVGTLTNSLRDFLPWNVDGDWMYEESPIEALIQGLFDKRRFLELIKHSVVFEENQSCITKKLLRYPFCTIP